MSDYISREEVLDYIDHMPSELTHDGRRMIRRIRLTEYISDSIPAADVAPVVHAHWTNKDRFHGTLFGDCSNCGARMDESEGEK